MDLGLSRKLFVVGGASKGLGRAVAEALVSEGARVILVSRDKDALDRVASGLGGRAVPCPADLSDATSIDALAARAGEEAGGLDGILVNAGGPPAGEALALSHEQWEQAFRLLIGGPLHLLRALVPRLNDRSSVLFVTSSSVRQPIPGLDSSNVLRPGVAALAKCLARELGPKVRVNSIAPGHFATERLRSLDEKQARAAGISVDEQVQKTERRIPLARYGAAEELARMATFLLSPASSYVTGASVQIDGGFVTATP